MLYFAYQIFKCNKMNTSIYASTLVLSNFPLKINFLKKKQGMESKNTMGMNEISLNAWILQSLEEIVKDMLSTLNKQLSEAMLRNPTAESNKVDILVTTQYVFKL